MTIVSRLPPPQAQKFVAPRPLPVKPAHEKPAPAALLPTPVGALAKHLQGSCEREMRSGLRLLVAGVLVVGVWGGFAPLSGAVILAGSLVSESHAKKVQHPSGGVVARIDVHDGDRVEAGAPLMRLDETSAKANLQVVTDQLDATRARIARLVAERDGAEDMATTGGSAVFAAEQNLFRARKTARLGQKALLTGRIGQLEEELRGLDAQMQSQAEQRRLIVTELKGVQTLYDKQLVPLTRLTGLQREAARLDGAQGQLVSSSAETHSKIDEAKLQVSRLDQDFRAEVMKDLRESQDRQAELTERAVAAQDLFDKIEIRAPVAGIVHQLAVHTIGGVVTSSEVLMEIVPEGDALQIEARLSPRDIDQAHVGQEAEVRFPAFNQRTTPELSGQVAYISPDAAKDAQGGAPAYQVRVILPHEQIEKLGALKLVPGMPAEVMLTTGDRTLLSYLFKPISDQFTRVFRER